MASDTEIMRNGRAASEKRNGTALLVRLDDELHARLAAYADEEGRPMAVIARLAIRAYLADRVVDTPTGGAT